MTFARQDFHFGGVRSDPRLWIGEGALAKGYEIYLQQGVEGRATTLPQQRENFKNIIMKNILKCKKI